MDSGEDNRPVVVSKKRVLERNAIAVDPRRGVSKPQHHRRESVSDDDEDDDVIAPASGPRDLEPNFQDCSVELSKFQSKMTESFIPLLKQLQQQGIHAELTFRVTTKSGKLWVGIKAVVPWPRGMTRDDVTNVLTNRLRDREK
jgi:hypothetical protein